MSYSLWQTLKVAVAIALLCTLSAGTSAAAETPTQIKLWENGAPGSPETQPDDEPVILMHQPAADQANGTSAIVIPGGAYSGLAMDNEGLQIAEWLNSLGVRAFVLKYRLSGTGHRHPVPMLDGQRAIRTLRARAGEWKLDPQKIIVVGFSAGGHLASTLATHFDAGDAKSDDAIERASSRPDFVVLCYPVITFQEDYTHQGSRRNLLGPEPDPKLVASLSNETQVTSETPPTFLFHTNEDSGVLPENSIAFYSALRRANVPAELHIYERGRHGVGLAKDVPATSSWPERCRDWMKLHGLVE